MQVSNWRSALNQGLIRIKIREIWIRITGPDQATNNHKSNTWDFRSCPPLLVVGRSLPPASNPATGPATHPGAGGEEKVPKIRTTLPASQ